MEFELGHAGPVHFYFVPALGISYVSNTYFTHSDNRFIGSHLNQLLKAALQMEIPLGENFGLLANVHVLHISNGGFNIRSEEHTSDLQSLMRISYAVLCLT